MINIHHYSNSDGVKVLRQINPLMLKLPYSDCDWEEKVLNIAPHWSLAFMFWPLGLVFFTELWANDNSDRVREVLIGRWSGCCWRKETLRSLMEEINVQRTALIFSNTGLFYMFVCGFWIKRNLFFLYLSCQKTSGMEKKIRDCCFWNFFFVFCYDVTFLLIVSVKGATS